jgi:hypothetical protein
MEDCRDFARLRDEENRQEFAISKAEREMEAEERQLEREADECAEGEANAKRKIEAEWRMEHWGRQPERPPKWRALKPPPARANH